MVMFFRFIVSANEISQVRLEDYNGDLCLAKEECSKLKVAETFVAVLKKINAVARNGW